MASLNGVRVLNDREIEYGGVRYMKTEGPEQTGDIVRNDVDYSFMPEGAYYLVNERLNIVVDDGDVFDYDCEENTLFRRIESAPQTPQSPAEIRAAIEKKRAEIAELEEQLEIREDDYVRVVGRSYNGDFTEDDIAQVTHLDESDSVYPYKIRAIIGNMTDWARADVVKITPAEAKAALIAQIEGAFGEAQTSA